MAARPLAAPRPSGVDITRVVARRRAFVDQHMACPLLDLLQKFPDLFVKEVLERLDPTDRTMIAQVGRPWLAAVLASGLPRLPKGVLVRLRLWQFCTSIERLAWAKANGCRWDLPSHTRAEGQYYYYTDRYYPCSLAAAGGHMEVLQWARKHGCAWGDRTCALAAKGGHRDVLRWAREHGCEWDSDPSTCHDIARHGHLEVLQWAWQEGCPWDAETCVGAATGGHLAVLQWAREHDCPWNWRNALFSRRYGRAPGDAAVDAGERRDQRGLEREHGASLRRGAPEAGGVDVAGATPCSLASNVSK